LARDAPGGPEVEDDHLAAQRGELELSRLVEARQREVLRLRRLAAAARHLPDQQREQRRDERDRQHLATELEARGHQAGTKITGVPTLTWPKSHSADGMNMRMQPCDAE